jgi:hypothetical protein
MPMRFSITRLVAFEAEADSYEAAMKKIDQVFDKEIEGVSIRKPRTHKHREPPLAVSPGPDGTAQLNLGVCSQCRKTLIDCVCNPA